MSQLVFCKGCKYYKRDSETPLDYADCLIDPREYITFYEKRSELVYCRDRNKKNDCEKFESK